MQVNAIRTSRSLVFERCRDTRPSRLKRATILDSVDGSMLVNRLTSINLPALLLESTTRTRHIMMLS